MENDSAILTKISPCQAMFVLPQITERGKTLSMVSQKHSMRNFCQLCGTGRHTFYVIISMEQKCSWMKTLPKEQVAKIYILTVYIFILRTSSLNRNPPNAQMAAKTK